MVSIVGFVPGPQSSRRVTLAIKSQKFDQSRLFHPGGAYGQRQRTFEYQRSDISFHDSTLRRFFSPISDLDFVRDTKSAILHNE